MNFPAELLGLLALRTRALRALAGRKSALPGWILLSLGFLSFALVRHALYAATEMRVGSGILQTALGLNLVQLLLFLSVVYIPAVICLSNAFAGDGLGFSFSREEYRVHVSVLFPLWGCIFFVAAVLQWLVPGFIGFGILEVSLGLLCLTLLMTFYSVWAIRQLNYLPLLPALSVFVLSWFTLPLFFVVSSFVFALPFFILVPVGYLLYQRLRGYISSRSGEGSFQEHLRSLTVNPQDADAHYQLGLIHLGRGNLDSARRYFQSALAIDPRDPDYQYHLGRVHEALEDWPGALEQFEETYRLNPGYALGDIFREVGKAYLHTGKIEKGVEFLRFFLKTRGSDPEGRYWLAVSLQKLGRAEEMRSELRTILDQARSNPRFFRKGNRRWLYKSRLLLRQSSS